MPFIDRTHLIIEDYPHINSGNKVLDVYLVQREICQNMLDSIINFWGSKNVDTHTYLMNLYFHLNLHKQPLPKEALPIEVVFFLQNRPSKKDCLDFLRANSPFELPDKFLCSLAEYYVAADTIAIDLKEQLDQKNSDIDAIIFERLITDTPFFTKLASLIGGLRHEFITRFELLSKIQQENIQKKGNEARIKKYSAIKEQVFKKFEEGRYHSYTDFANKEFQNFGVSYSTLTKWLSELSKS